MNSKLIHHLRNVKTYFYGLYIMNKGFQKAALIKCKSYIQCAMDRMSNYVVK